MFHLKDVYSLLIKMLLLFLNIIHTETVYSEKEEVQKTSHGVNTTSSHTCACSLMNDHPYYLSLGDKKQIEFLSLFHFNICQEENIKDPHKRHPPTAMWFSHLFGPVTQTAEEATALLDVFVMRRLEAEPTS